MVEPCDKQSSRDWEKDIILIVYFMPSLIY